MTSEIIDTKDLKNDPVFGQLSFDNHEQIVFCNDEDTGLKAIIGIHNTTLGPALGGTRMWQYTNEWEALNDVLRLSRGMTYKSAITGLNLGGGKAVIIGDAKTQKNDALMRKFGEYVNSLSGRYITAEDIGMETRDMDVIREVTPHVTGVSEAIGGWGGINNPPIEIEFTCTKVMATYFKEKKIHSTQEIKCINKDLYNISIVCAHSSELTRLLSSFGGNLLSVTPKNLWDDIQNIWSSGLKIVA